MNAYNVFKYEVNRYGEVAMTKIGEVHAFSATDAVLVAKSRTFDGKLSLAPVIAPV